MASGGSGSRLVEDFVAWLTLACCACCASRFYFVSTADLLDILSNGNSPTRVMMHMSKCFQVTQGRRWSFPVSVSSLVCPGSGANITTLCGYCMRVARNN